MGETFLERPARAGGTGGCSGNGGSGTLLVPPMVGWVGGSQGLASTPNRGNTHPKGRGCSMGGPRAEPEVVWERDWV